MRHLYRSRHLAACIAILSLASAAPALASDLFSADAYLEHVKYLAGDELSGRLPGTEGIEMAADYIARHFAQAGLKPGGEDGTWFQSFEVRRGKKLVDAEALLEISGITRTWKVRKDWIPMPFTAQDNVEGPLAFAGYGIKADLHEYNDYADFNADGKVLLIFRYEPRSDDPEADFGGRKPSIYSQFRRKVRTADRQGAMALLVVNPPLRAQSDDSLYAFDAEAARETYSLPIVHITRDLGERIVQQAGLGSLESLQKQLDEQRKPLAADTGMSVKLKTGVKPHNPATRNVIGLLPAAGDTAETIVLGAHYDHLGLVPMQFERGDDTKYIHNGADDNASGTAAVIELARSLSKVGGLRRNVLFIAFSAEEMGLLGSKHFIEHPTLDLDDVKAMINFDMVGRLSMDKFVVYGIPSASEFSDLVSGAAAAAKVKYRAAEGLTNNSDHAGFYQHGIPYLFAFTGVHKQYHRPSDDWELVDAPGAAKIVEMFHSIIHQLADMRGGPTFAKLSDATSADDLQMKPGVEHDKEVGKDQDDDKPDNDGEATRPQRPRARLGIIPDFAGSGDKGVLVDTAIDGGPAKTGGLRDGDLIVRIADHKITDIYAYMAALGESEPGQTVDVVVIRDEEEVTCKVKLAKPHGKSHGASN